MKMLPLNYEKLDMLLKQYKCFFYIQSKEWNLYTKYNLNFFSIDYFRKS